MVNCSRRLNDHDYMIIDAFMRLEDGLETESTIHPLIPLADRNLLHVSWLSAR
jgi:hypothetical protein